MKTEHSSLHHLDASVMERIARNDETAFAEAYAVLAGPVFSLALRILGTREDAEEVVQEVFTKLWRESVHYDPARGTPIAWALTITRFKAIDRFRSARRRESLHRNPAAEGATAQGEPPTSDHHAVIHEDASAVRNVLARLPQEQREAIEMAFFGGLTQNEIAGQLQEPLGTVKARIRRGMLKLREFLKGIR